MIAMKKVAPIAAFASILALGGCTEGYGYGGVNVGYGSGYYYDDYPYGPYAPYGWYDDYYYPGNGYWLYDRGGARHRWSDRQRRYWEQRREHGGKWDGPATRPWRPEMRGEHRWRGRADGTQVQRIPRSEARQVPQSAQEAQPMSPAPQQRIERRRRD